MEDISSTDALFGQAIRQRRSQLGITLEQLAHVSGVSIGALSKIERGRLSPSLRNAVAIAHALGCEMGDLLSAPTTAVNRYQDNLIVVDAATGIERRTLARPSVDLEFVSYTMPVGTRSTQFAPHQRGSKEIFYVVAGSLNVCAGQEVLALHAGDTAIITVDVEHWFENTGNEVAQFTLLNLMGTSGL